MTDQRISPYSLRPMRLGDVSQVAAIEREAFPTLWAWTNYNRGLRNLHEKYLVCVHRGQETSVFPEHRRGLWDFVRRKKPPLDTAKPSELIVGFVGIWFTGGEGHIISIAVRQAYRRQGLGELLLMGAVESTERSLQQVLTLEVRVSNTIAQSLYRKYGFSQVGIRRRYYSDNQEDALIMSTDTITSLEYRHFFQALRTEFTARYGETDEIES